MLSASLNKTSLSVSVVDYDALLSENGNITQKYLTTRFLLFEFVLKKQGMLSFIRY